MKDTKTSPVIENNTKVLSSIVTKLEAIPKVEITDTQSLTQATEYLSQANKYLDTLTKDKETMTKPLNEALKAIRAKYKPTETKLELIISEIRQALTIYQTEQIRLKKIEEDKIVSRIGDGKGHIKIETAVAKIEALPEVQKKTTTDSGSISFKTVKKFRIVNIARIPRDLMIPNEKAIEEQMKSGYSVEGVEYYEEQVPINRRS
jgi:hypothetical protein